MERQAADENFCSNV